MAFLMAALELTCKMLLPQFLDLVFDQRRAFAISGLTRMQEMYILQAAISSIEGTFE